MAKQAYDKKRFRRKAFGNKQPRHAGVKAMPSKTGFFLGFQAKGRVPVSNLQDRAELCSFRSPLLGAGLRRDIGLNVGRAAR